MAVNIGNIFEKRLLIIREMKKCILGLIFAVCSQMIYSQDLHLYGGDKHDVYLGCLTCGKYDSNSIWNEYGTYGNKYNSNCIWNKYGTYGSKYSVESPWNPYSSTPPVVVDKKDSFYGYFTVDKNNTKRADFKLALIIYKYHDLIPDNVSDWYDKISED